VVGSSGVPFGVVLASSMSAYNSRVKRHDYAPVQLLTGAHAEDAVDVDLERQVQRPRRGQRPSRAPRHPARGPRGVCQSGDVARVRCAVNSKMRSRLLPEANLVLGAPTCSSSPTGCPWLSEPHWRGPGRVIGYDPTSKGVRISYTTKCLVRHTFPACGWSCMARMWLLLLLLLLLFRPLLLLLQRLHQRLQRIRMRALTPWLLPLRRRLLLLPRLLHRLLLLLPLLTGALVFSDMVLCACAPAGVGGDGATTPVALRPLG
jgi:hypothetical protein